MDYLNRKVKKQIQEALQPGKVIILLGPRRVGKTILLKQLIHELEEPYLLLNGEDMDSRKQLESRSLSSYKRLLGNTRMLIIDEAQKIPEVGQVLKLMVDEIQGLKVVVAGSSAFDINKYTGEPLTGRKKTFHLYALSESEFSQQENGLEKMEAIKHRMVFGNYPELQHVPDIGEKKEYLQDLVNSYLLRDILEFENVRNADKILDLLRLIAFQVGNEVSNNELSKKLGISKNTVERYLDLLAKVFVLHPVSAFSRNLRKEITKGKKWYFYDNGLRNILVGNMNALDLRNDVGALWENYAISERLKQQSYERMLTYNFFWRTYDQQEIDWIEEREGALFAYEFKWRSQKKAKLPKIWENTYEKTHFEVMNPDNFLDWVDPQP